MSFNSNRKRRRENTLVICPIVYGSIANLITGKKVEEYATHRWTLYGKCIYLKANILIYIFIICF